MWWSAMLKWLRSKGWIGSLAAFLLTLLTTQWAAVMAAIIAIFIALQRWGQAFVASAPVLTALAVWLVLWWTYVGFRLLAFQQKPRKVESHLDYRFGLTFEGVTPGFVPADATDLPNPGTLSIQIHLRNYSPGPIYYTIESLDMRLGTRSVPKYKPGTFFGYMARGAGRLSNTEGFSRDDLEKFFGKGLTKGTMDFAVAYGPPDEPPIRRLIVSLELFVAIPHGGVAPVGFANNILSERDEPISTR